MTATLHLISGLPCAGKTTYAERLQETHDAARFSLDRWLITSYGRYPVDVVGHDEHVRRVYACRELIWAAGAELLRRGADVILDDGFFLRTDRLHYIEAATALGATATTHWIDTAAAEIRHRIAERNQRLGPYNFEIATDALEAYIALFEHPTADEGAEVVVVRD